MNTQQLATLLRLPFVVDMGRGPQVDDGREIEAPEWAVLQAADECFERHILAIEARVIELVRDGRPS